MLVAALLSSSGCSLFTRYIYVPSRWPLIHPPKKAAVYLIKKDDLQPLEDELEAKLLHNLQVQAQYEADLVSAVKTYNESAEKHNKPETEKPD